MSSMLEPANGSKGVARSGSCLCYQWSRVLAGDLLESLATVSQNVDTICVETRCATLNRRKRPQRRNDIVGCMVFGFRVLIPLIYTAIDGRFIVIVGV